MIKPDALEILMLLTALESWSFSTGKTIPDYLMDRIQNAIDVLREEILHD